MRIVLCDLNNKLCAEWERAFGRVEGVEVKNQDIFTCGKFDAIISPANSFGFMDGGIDGVYTKYFGKQLQADLQSEIKKLPMREVLVGQTVVVPTKKIEIPYLISAPTMRVPLDISDTANPYLAFKAALCAAKENNFQSILCPGLGTLTGNVEPGDCARQMFTAYKEFNDRYPKYPNSIAEAYREHLSLVGYTNVKRNRKTW